MMTSNKTDSPRLQKVRIRFSLRTLAVSVSLICIYLGVWELTKNFGVRSSSVLLQLADEAGQPIPAAITAPKEDSPGPFLIRRTVYGDMSGTYEYYVWFFTGRLKLPYHRAMNRH